MREKYLKAIQDRFMAFTRSQDGSSVLAPEAVAEAVRLLGPGYADQGILVRDPEALMWVGMLHWARYESSPIELAGRDLHTMLKLFAMVHDIAPQWLHPLARKRLDEAGELVLDQRVRTLTVTGRRMADEGARRGDLVLIDRAIGVLLEAVEMLPARHPLRAGSLNDVGSAWLTRYHNSGLGEDGEHALRMFRESVAAADAEDLPEMRVGLSNGARMVFDRTGRPEHVEEAVNEGRASVEATSPDDPRRGTRLNVLAVALRSRFEGTGNMADLDAAVTLLRTAAEAATADHGTAGMQWSDLCLALRIRFEHSGDAADLREAVTAGRAALRDTGDDALPGTRSARLWSLGTALSTSYVHFGIESDLVEATECAEAAVSLTPPGHTEETRALHLLATVTALRFELTGDIDLIGRAVEHHRRAVRIMPDDYWARDAVRTGLAASLLRRFSRMGRVADLDDAVLEARAAVESSERGTAGHAACVDTFRQALLLRYRHTGEPADLAEAAEVARRAIAAMGPDVPDRPLLLANLSDVLMNLFAARKNPAYRQEAITLAREAFATIGAANVSRGKIALNLAFVLAGGRDELDGDREDLAEAERLCLSALAEAPRSEGSAEVLNLLGLITASTSDGRLTNLDRAVDAHQQALDLTPPDDPARAATLVLLGTARQHRFAVSDDPADAEAAIDAYRAAASHPLARPEVRAKAARFWSMLAMTRDDHAEALEGFTAAVALLPDLTGRRLNRTTRENLIADWTGVAADAAACALQVGRPRRAVELLDHGRSVLWADALRSQQDLSALLAHVPDLAERFTGLRARLAAADADVADLDPTSTRRRRDAHTRLVTEWEELLQQIRGLPGFEHFLLPMPFADLTQAAAGGPVVLVNTSRLRCDALIVTAAGVDVLPLPLDLDDALRMCNVLLSVITDLTGTGLASRVAARSNLRSLLAELWDRIAEPVLTHLGFEGELHEDETAPRVWWCLVGPLSFQPIHAAGRDSDRVFDRVVSSYTPTLSILTSARARPVSDAVPSVLAIGLPETPGQAPLPSVDDELRVLSSRLAPLTTPTVLRGEEATRDAVTQLLEDHRWAHFCCHGHQDITEPANGQIRLWDRPLTVRDLVALRLTQAELAFLSACDTAVGGIALIDESISLASGLSAAGYRHVIGTLWSADDGQSPAVADAVYATLVRPEGVDAAALAVHRATRELHRRLPRRPEVWACYVHVGP
ncbi:CHAT domain-containing protein [Lentzea sp. NPDC092896]|uniref:CHAT domain-containing protein n=1 Tax=Lentzea sp. NPDC092896 TaxID=3364127 RepID=UPI0037F1E674